MANTADMLRLMRHAADLLDAADPTPTFKAELMKISYSDERATVAARLATVTAAMANAKAMLRMVAAAMDDEPTPPPPDLDEPLARWEEELLKEEQEGRLKEQAKGFRRISGVECPTCHRRIGHNGYGYPVPHTDPNTGTRCKSGKPVAELTSQETSGAGDG
jgi:hypothetical protein